MWHVVSKHTTISTEIQCVDSLFNINAQMTDGRLPSLHW